MKNRVKKNRKFGNTVLIVTSLSALSVAEKYTGVSYSLLSLGALGMVSAPVIPILKKMNSEVEEYNKQRKLVFKMDQNENKED